MSLLALQDLFLRYREKATGVWKLGQDPGRTIYFDYGDTVFAQSTHLQDRLTYILVERGKVTQAQMDYALANLKAGLSIGKNLIEMGFITQRDLLEVAKAQVERIIWGALAVPAQAPAFEAKELDANVVRLPLNTPQLLLSGVLALQDREGLLELLGPLNQVVVLQGKALLDLTLPPDLAKLPPLLDGTHTLLELSRESMAEPVRLGAFALFLREMGWARLHEMPPLDRHALDLAFTPEPEPLSFPLPASFPETVPSLFSTIQEAQRPTTNLEHLSQALDAEPPVPEPFLEGLQELPDLPEPDLLDAVTPAEGILLPDLTDAGLGGVQTGQAQLPTPALALPSLPEPGEEARVVLSVPLDCADPLEPQAPPAEPAPPRRPLAGLLAVLALIAVLGAGFYGFRHRKPRGLPPVAPIQTPVVVTVPAPTVAPEPAPPESEAPALPEPGPALPAAKPSEPAPQPKVEPKTPVRIGTSLAERLATLAKGDLDLALRQGDQRIKELPASHWILRLEIACQGDTIRRVAELFKGEQPDLLLLSIQLRDGRTCYQVFHGHYPSRAAAEAQIQRLPAAFRAEGNKPKAFKISEIPKRQ